MQSYWQIASYTLVNHLLDICSGKSINASYICYSCQDIIFNHFIHVLNSTHNLMMYSLILLYSLLHITTSTVYTVTPDDHHYPNTTCHHCHNLQHYLLNVTKYFTSNTQILFLPGLHYLDTDLIIQNVHNISLIGSTANSTTVDTVIQCMYGGPAHITIANVSTLIIKNLIVEVSDMYVFYNQLTGLVLRIENCFSISLQHIQVKPLDNYYFALEGTNILGSSYFNHITLPKNSDIRLQYNEAPVDRRYNILTLHDCTVTTLHIDMLQQSYIVILKIENVIAQHNKKNYFISVKELGINEIFIISCQFISNHYKTHLFSFASSSYGSIHFINCQFIDNVDDYYYTVISVWVQKSLVESSLIKIYSNVKMKIINCIFVTKSPQTAGIILTHYSMYTANTHVIIKNTSFIIHTISEMHGRSFSTSLITLTHTKLLLEDSVVFSNITTPHSIISLTGNSAIIISGSVGFSHNHVHDLINFYDNNRKYIIMKENSVINVFNNNATSLFVTQSTLARYPYPFCLFQYFSNNTSTLTLNKRKFLIRFYNNQCTLILRSGCQDFMPVTHCLWLPELLFNNTIPLEVNSKYIQFINNSGTYKLSQIIEQSSLCVCTNELHYDCHTNDLGYLYPGQTLTTSLYHYNANTTNAVVVKTDINQRYVTPCIVLDINEHLQLIDQKCNKLHYTIGFPTDNWCQLFLKLASDSDDYLNIFSIWQITCPTGFAKLDKRCQCDPVLAQIGIAKCNINDQTILRPADSWISATTHNNSYAYNISLHCPFHYCLPHSSHLNFSTPNSQCQFNRSGLLCGHCQQGLSTVFGSSYCQKCSNIFILLIIPIAIAGVVLVLLLFVLNLTVTDGTINGFILYVNIISFNAPTFFIKLNHFTPAYIFISLANLDLGIQTCFYNGMDDYAKMWLQLAFPFYLIFIATIMIITSRYSTTVQRLTARRALPVLATLFLLSYTKILRIVSRVLFSYSTITHLPSKHTTLVWSVDANVPLFGVRFAILYIVCVILFLILVPFNVILLFTRTLSRFRFVNQFKPLLDAYQGPYKDKFYYWTGLQLLMRGVFFGISSLDRNLNYTVSIILFGIVGGVHGIVRPFKKKYKNYQELLLILNLQGLFAILQYTQVINITVVNIIIAMAAVQFIFMITYHIITYVCGGVIRSKIQLSINTNTGWITRLHHRSQHQQFQLKGNIRDNIPEVAYNYREYREPLVGQEYNSHAM